MKFPRHSPKTCERDIPILPLEKCLAKTCRKDGVLQKGCNVYTHLKACATCVDILHEIYKDTPREKFLGNEVRFLAALHDIGKISPSFQTKIYHALSLDDEVKEIDAEENDRNRHAKISGESVDKQFHNEFSARLIAGHHGHGCPSLTISAESEIFGGPKWESLREEMTRKILQELHINTIPQLGCNDPQNLVYLGGLILADWLSSSLEIGENEILNIEDLKRTIFDAGFRPFEIQKGLGFTDIFGFTPNPLQVTVSENISAGATYIIESEMGSGKTEAALFLAYKLLESKQANGIYFALPTQLTSEKIHDRMNDFLNKILADAPSQSKTGLLVHGNSWMDWVLKNTNDDDMETPDNINAWFEQKKRALLAPFAVGTVDQSLMSVINVAHNSVRAFGLSGKVVIIDEVHSYDAYTGSLIQSLVSKLREWGATVVILSATLTKTARASLLACEEDELHSNEYPLLSLKNEHKNVREISFSGGLTKSVKIEHTHEMEDAYKNAIDVAEKGGEVLWIENTIQNAQNVFLKLRAILPPQIECGLIHSRFPKSIRHQKESYWVELYGKKGDLENKRFQKGRILVGTQVLEQSVDIDSDFLVTQLAPSDMLLQRIGRLWRHRKFDAKRKADSCRALIIHPKFSSTFPEALKSEALPYDPYTLYRTSKVWNEKASISLPDDIRALLEATYETADESEKIWALLLKQVLDEKQKLERAAVGAQSLIFNTQNDDESIAPTRYSDMKSVDVLLIPRKYQSAFSQGQIYTLADPETPICLPKEKPPHKEAVQITSQLMQAMIRVADYDAPPYDSFPLEILKDYIWIGDGKIRPIRAAFIDNSSHLLNQSMQPIFSNKVYTYKDLIGYHNETKGSLHD